MPERIIHFTHSNPSWKNLKTDCAEIDDSAKQAQWFESQIAKSIRYITKGVENANPKFLPLFKGVVFKKEEFQELITQSNNGWVVLSLVIIESTNSSELASTLLAFTQNGQTNSYMLGKDRKMFLGTLWNEFKYDEVIEECRLRKFLREGEVAPIVPIDDKEVGDPYLREVLALAKCTTTSVSNSLSASDNLQKLRNSITFDDVKIIDFEEKDENYFRFDWDPYKFQSGKLEDIILNSPSASSGIYDEMGLFHFVRIHRNGLEQILDMQEEEKKKVEYIAFLPFRAACKIIDRTTYEQVEGGEGGYSTLLAVALDKDSNVILNNENAFYYSDQPWRPRYRPWGNEP